MYNVLSDKFRHNKEKMTQHKMRDEAVNIFMQYDINYHPLFEV